MIRHHYRMTATPRPVHDTPAMMSYKDVVAFLLAQGATDYPGYYAVTAAGVFNTATCAFHACDTTPLYEALGAPFGAELTIGATQVTIKQHVLLRTD